MPHILTGLSFGYIVDCLRSFACLQNVHQTPCSSCPRVTMEGSYLQADKRSVHVLELLTLVILVLLQSVKLLLQGCLLGCCLLQRY